jgi:uncharacterized membrane protein
MNEQTPTPQPAPVPVMRESFSIQEAFTVGWNLFVKHWELFLTIQFVTTLILLLASWCTDQTLEGTPSRLIATVLNLGLKLIIGLGLMFVYLRIHDGEPTEALDVFDPLPLFWSYAAVMVVYLIGVGIGTFLLVLPGIVLAAGWFLAQYMVIDTNVDPFEALKISWKKTLGHKVNITLFGACALIINFIGMIPFGFGLLITLPVTGIAYAHAYRYFFPKGVTA